MPRNCSRSVISIGAGQDVIIVLLKRYQGSELQFGMVAMNEKKPK